MVRQCLLTGRTWATICLMQQGTGIVSTLFQLLIRAPVNERREYFTEVATWNSRNSIISVHRHVRAILRINESATGRPLSFALWAQHRGLCRFRVGVKVPAGGIALAKSNIKYKIQLRATPRPRATRALLRWTKTKTQIESNFAGAEKPQRV